MPYAFGLDEKGKPDAEMAARCDEAFAIAQHKPHATIFLGAGMGTYAKARGASSLATAAFFYLRDKKNLPSRQMLIYAHGYSTVTETMTFYEFLKSRPQQENTEIAVATSWWHAPRVRMICRIIFGKPVTVYTCPCTRTYPQLAFDIAREIAAFPSSFFRAMQCIKNMRNA